MLKLCRWDLFTEDDEDFCLVKAERKNYEDKPVKREHVIQFDHYFGLHQFKRLDEVEKKIQKKIDEKETIVTVYGDKKRQLGCVINEDYSVFVLTDLENIEYTIVGIIGGHPFIITPHFYYGNSDGSCVEYEYYLETLGEHPSLSEIFATLCMFYYDFVHDSYH